MLVGPGGEHGSISEYALRAAVSCSRPRRTSDIRNSQPSGAATTWMFPPSDSGRGKMAQGPLTSAVHSRLDLGSQDRPPFGANVLSSRCSVGPPTTRCTRGFRTKTRTSQSRCGQAVPSSCPVEGPADDISIRRPCGLQRTPCSDPALDRLPRTDRTHVVHSIRRICGLRNDAVDLLVGTDCRVAPASRAAFTSASDPAAV
jgi:hypothetical protein